MSTTITVGYIRLHSFIWVFLCNSEKQNNLFKMYMYATFSDLY